VARPKMPEKTRQEMFAHWVQSNNYLQTGKAFGYSANTVKNVVREMPEYFAREHEHQRMEFVREAWLLARKALREIDRKLADGDLKEVSVALGIIAQRATNAMFAAQKARTPEVFVHNQQEISANVISAEALAAGIRQARLEQQHGTENDERRDFLEQVYGRPPRSVG
jgi:hypothetical protein